MIKKSGVVLWLLLVLSVTVHAQSQDAQTLFYKMRQRFDAVKDYVADVKMKIDISYMRVPMLHGKLYFKSPDKLKLERNGGISILPRKSINMTVNNLIPAGDATVIDAGYEMVGTVKTHVIKVVPDNDKTDIVLTRIWIDEQRLLALRTETTTRDNGTIKMDLEYDKYADLALPDKVTFFVDVKDYKLPKGVTMDYDNSEVPVKKQADGKPKKGKIQITYLNYKINTGLADDIFVEKKK